MTEKFDVVGIGNAIVDVIAPGDDLFLDSMGITKGIMQLISYCEPRNVMLVHGEAAKMEFLKAKVLIRILILYIFCFHYFVFPALLTGQLRKSEIV